jgi:predicted metal-dependent peptidase
MPKGGLFDDKYAGMNAQQVFNMLSDDGDDEKDKDKGGGTNINPFDDHDWESAEQLSEEEEQQLAKEVDEAVRQGVLAAGKLGTGGTRDMVELLEPKKDWRELLREYVTTTCSGKDYSTWRKPNRKYVGMDMLMPSTISESMNDIVVAIDMSGSIGTEEQIAFLSEVKGICEQVKPNKVHVMYWDTEVCGHEVYLQDELDNLTKSTKPVGGGGTMVECVPTYMAEHNIKPECVVVLTDGYLGGSWGQWVVPVLWCIHNNKHASPSAGVAIHI